MNNNQSAKSNIEMDDRLAKYTNELMSGKAQPSDTSDPELLRLEDTVHHLKSMTDADSPKPELSSLLELKLQSAWEEQYKRSGHGRKNWTLRLPGWLTHPSPWLQFAVFTFVLAITLISLLPSDLPLQGAAGDQGHSDVVGSVSSILPWIAIISLACLLIILIWTYRKK